MMMIMIMIIIIFASDKQSFNSRMGLGCQTGVGTAIAAQDSGRSLDFSLRNFCG